MEKSLQAEKNLFLIACCSLQQLGFSQNKTVTGTVTDATGEPLIGHPYCNKAL